MRKAVWTSERERVALLRISSVMPDHLIEWRYWISSVYLMRQQRTAHSLGLVIDDRAFGLDELIIDHLARRIIDRCHSGQLVALGRHAL